MACPHFLYIPFRVISVVISNGGHRRKTKDTLHNRRKPSPKKPEYKQAPTTDMRQIMQQELGERPHFVPKK